MARYRIVAIAAALALFPLSEIASAQMFFYGPGGFGVRIGPSRGFPGPRPGFAFPPAAPFYWYGDDARADYQPRSRRAGEVPTAEQLADMTWGQLVAVLSLGAERLDERLNRFNTGAGWERYLQVAALREELASLQGGPPSEQTIARLSKINAAFDAAAANDEFRVITQLAEFRVVRAALAESLVPPPVRTRRQLLASWQRLADSLDDVRTGAGWKNYLELPSEAVGDGDAEADRQVLSILQDRFQRVNDNPQYRVIARLPGFQATRRNLTAYVDSMSEGVPLEATPSDTLPSPAASPSTQGEELQLFEEESLPAPS